MSLIDYVRDTISKGESSIDLEFAEKFMFIAESKDQFPVDINLLVEWGIDSKKGHAKDRLKKYFSENKDFRKTASERSEAVNGGQNKEEIRISVECFKGMCMMANNEVGKKTREYYLALESIVKKYIEQEYNSLKERESLQSETLNSLLNENQKLTSNLYHKKRVNVEQKKGLYIFGYKEIPGLYKIGKTVNVRQRTTPVTDVPYDLHIYHFVDTDHINPIEKLIQYTLLKYRVKNYKEWFTGDLEILKHELDICVEFFESRISAHKNIDDDKIIDDTVFSKYIKQQDIESDIEIILEETEESKESDILVIDKKCKFIITRGEKQGQVCLKGTACDNDYCNRHLRSIDPTKIVKNMKTLVKEKYCPKCDTKKLSELFGKNSLRTDGLNSYCTICTKSYAAQLHKNKVEKKKIIECPVCKTDKTFAQFYKNRPECKDCTVKMYENDELQGCVKICSICKHVKEIEHYHENDNYSDGVNSMCNLCIKEREDKSETNQVKTCKVCNVQLDLLLFHKDKTVDGLMTKCKTCWKKKYYD
ncbi:MAG: GIY-YIG nuclease family protein [Candidatus Colwellbacteria bacterium]|nr:GIY-YIG nuclease family protein [Candidatus Colwellbacteria bacterium]